MKENANLSKPSVTGGFFVMFATLLLFWVMLMGSLSYDVLIVGVLSSLVIAFMYPEGLSFFTEFRATPAAFVDGFKYYGYFLSELVKSNIRVAGIVISPSLLSLIHISEPTRPY